jgi:hypothetical protein
MLLLSLFFFNIDFSPSVVNLAYKFRYSSSFYLKNSLKEP